MKKFLQKRKRKGFTLVELLIVIIIIGILAGSMLLVMGSGRDKAEATKIVSNLRSMKSAALMCYADFNAWPASGDAGDSLDAYMDATIDTAYQIEENSSGDVYIGLVDSIDEGVQTKLVQMAGDSRLFEDLAGTAYSGGDSVYMLVDKASN